MTIGDECVTLKIANDAELLLIWRRDQVQWFSETGEITYTGPRGESFAISSGDVITVGGESLIGDTGAQTDVDWIVHPDESCPGERFIVHSASRGGT
ncbi:MAG: hypothetical protein ACRDWX_12395 [Acidimicrobiia bacterium]